MLTVNLLFGHSVSRFTCRLCYTGTLASIIHGEISSSPYVIAGAGGPSMDAESFSSILQKERLDMRAHFEAEAEAERQRIRQELQEKIRQELQQSVT